jgi:hypothetical protein
LVGELIEQRSLPELPVLDPFSGTGTTITACAERGVACAAVELNPFLCWLARAKSRNYLAADLVRAEELVGAMARAARRGRGRDWVPNLHRIEKWWNETTLLALSRAHAVMASARGKARDLAALAFCRTLIDSGNVSFRHQSMSFRERDGAADVAFQLENAFAALLRGARTRLAGAARAVVLGDARSLSAAALGGPCGSVITSPPYVNRMSYVRELRPYMYWLGFFTSGRDAGELDWRAIGGTWGIATSKLHDWQPEVPSRLVGLAPLLGRIERHSPVLARYVERYFCDMQQHLESLQRVLAPGARAHYVIGNSKFFDVLVPAEALLAELFTSAGFVEVSTRTLRRRTSKRELYEYLVTAELPRAPRAGRGRAPRR